MATIERDVEYDAQRHLMTDIYPATSAQTRGTILLLHGGGWFRGDKAKEAQPAGKLATAGYQVVVPNFRLAPANHYPAPLVDMDTLVSWLRTSGRLTDFVAVVGASSGGNMSVEVGLKYGWPTVSLSGILNIEEWLQEHPHVVGSLDHQAPANADTTAIDQDGQDDEFYKGFIEQYFATNQDYHAGTPYHHVTAQAGPMYLANSMNEFVPNDGVLRLATALVAQQVPVTVRFLPGTRHGEAYLGDVWSDVLAFIQRAESQQG
ncbi:alpha/beta hydrolase [Lacticaseibacillus thailandensis]|uniref:Esterase lipase n=1 Tax=Lacticaseibacillus thailandensis DSM 22698 = JCM 13996 TaxID=1423810 RepID=A0A0R2CHV4_9LACO|nr:alpha/beta hydrolase [Lacticaseibacillus thailandensis]KRM87251.1 esterase lipase [Lacticaseibacillus thailandensis DSM 22698 = JCM 13996]